MRSIITDNLDRITSLLVRSHLIGDKSYELVSLSGDGSDRIFYRVVLQNSDSLLVVLPSQSSQYAMEEARSCDSIGRHLAKLQIAVPEVLFFEHKTGAVIYEFLGDLLLHDLVCSSYANQTHRLSLQIGISTDVENKYYATLDQLIKLQIDGRNGFIKEYCWESVSYDKSLMLARESGYFLNSFCRDFLGMVEFDDNLTPEFECLAERILEESFDYLMHRDFQSRNIMIFNDNVRIIDFQGARFGPLAYDLASLLNDPYVNLPYSQREVLLEYYIEKINERFFIDRNSFIDGYNHVALQRNLQVLGAFAYLSKVKGKIFFHKYIQPAITDLGHKMAGLLKFNYPNLAELVSNILLEQKWKNQNYN